MRTGGLAIDAGFYLPSLSNQTHRNWVVQSKIAKEHRFLGLNVMRSALKGTGRVCGFSEPYDGNEWDVLLKRLAPMQLDSDNLAGAFKSIRDGIADAMGMDDKWEGKIKWRYDQSKSPAYGIRIELKKSRPT